MNIKTITEIDIIEWRGLVNESKVNTFFQTPECYQFYRQLSCIEPFLLGVVEGDKLMGIACGYVVSEGSMIKRLFNKRAIIPGGLLLSNEISQQATTLLIEKIKEELKKKAIYIEIRNLNNYSNIEELFAENGFVYQEHLNIQVDFSTHDFSLKSISATKRRHIKLTQQAGVTCTLSTNKKDILAFYEILSRLYSRKIKLPLFPFSFFYNLVNEPFARLFVVKENWKVLGGMLCVFDKNTMYEWYVCGEKIFNKKIYPSTLATWTAMKYAKENGFKRFDFMGAGQPNKKYGVREFKSRFGGNIVENGRFLYIFKPKLYKFSKFVLEKILRALRS